MIKVPNWLYSKPVHGTCLDWKFLAKCTPHAHPGSHAQMVMSSTFIHLCNDCTLEWKQLQHPWWQPMEIKSFSTFIKMHMLTFKVPQVSKTLIHILAIGIWELFSIFLVCGLQSMLLAVSGQLSPWRSNSGHQAWCAYQLSSSPVTTWSLI